MRGALRLLPLFLHSVMSKYGQGSLPLRKVRLFKAGCIQGWNATVLQPHPGCDVSRFFTHAERTATVPCRTVAFVKVHVLVGKI